MEDGKLAAANIGEGLCPPCNLEVFVFPIADALELMESLEDLEWLIWELFNVNQSDVFLRIWHHAGYEVCRDEDKAKAIKALRLGLRLLRSKK